jgi:hypothetical protein
MPEGEILRGNIWLQEVKNKESKIKEDITAN